MPSDRIKRAQAQRRQLRANAGSMSAAMNMAEDAIEMSATTTIVCIFLLLSLGASLTSSYIMMNNPGCLGQTMISKSDNNAPDAASSSSYFRGNLPAASVPAAAPKPVPVPAPKPVPVPAVPIAPIVPGAACTAEYLGALNKQLPLDGCNAAPYLQACSFTMATKGCKDPFWMREVYASLVLTGEDNRFSSVFIGATKSDPMLMDMLHVTSHNTAVYDPKKFREQFAGGSRCPAPKPVAALAAEQPVQALLIEPRPDEAQAWASQRQKMGIAEDKIVIVPNEVGSSHMSDQKTTVDRVIANLDTFKDAPIHYMRVAINGNDYEILVGSSATLDRVRYLEFEYEWKGTWARHSLEDLIKQRLAAKGIVCYWHGSDGNLWRITDCWQAHYTHHQWSHITCVNPKFPEVKPIHDKMEQLFSATLQKNLKFGEA